MVRASAHFLVLSSAAASVGALGVSSLGKPAPQIPPGYTLVYGNDSMREDNLAPTRGGLEGIHTYDDRGVKGRNADLHVTIEDPGNFWPTSRGPWPSMGDIALSEAPPANLASNLAWSWSPPSEKFQTVIAGSPVIDEKRNIFLAATDGLRKFKADGTVLWHKKSHMGGLAHSASIHGSMVMMSHTNGNVMSLDKETGKVLWSRRWTRESPQFGVYPAGYGGKWVFGTEIGNDTRRPGGSMQAWGLRAESGGLGFQFRGDNPFVNFAPLFPGDDTMVLMDFTGKVYRVDLRDGELIWKSVPKGNHRSYSEGGAVIGPNEVIYTCSNPGTSYGREGEKGALRAYALRNGTLLWEQILPHPCNGNPSIGNLNQDDPEHLSVVVTPGGNLNSNPDLHGSVMAFDAKTGGLHWRYQAPRINKPVGPVNLMWQGSPSKGPYDGTCSPAHWSGPRIAKDGSVWASRADGHIYNVKGPVKEVPHSSIALYQEEGKLDLDFATTAGVQAQQTFVGGSPMAGSMAFSPGMTVATTCNGLHVFHH